MIKKIPLTYQPRYGYTAERLARTLAALAVVVRVGSRTIARR